MAKYVGVDRSPQALAAAAPRVANLGPRAELVTADFVDFLEVCDDRFDVIYVGLSAHHLRNAGLRRFFPAIGRRLAPFGLFAAYEPFTLPDETRDEHIDRFCQIVDHYWLDMPAEHRAGAQDPRPRKRLSDRAEAVELARVGRWTLSCLHGAEDPGPPISACGSFSRRLIRAEGGQDDHEGQFGVEGQFSSASQAGPRAIDQPHPPVPDRRSHLAAAPATWSQRPRLAGPLPIPGRPGRRPPARRSEVHRGQPGAGRDGGRSVRIYLVEPPLPWRRACRSHPGLVPGMGAARSH